MKNYLDGSMSYSQYLGLIDTLLTEGRTTGPDRSEAMFNYGKMNRQRMSRLEKTIKLIPDVIEAAKNVTRPVVWLIITEGWCGDAAQNIPAIEKIAAQSVNIETRYILRDENPDLMDQYLTRGSRSIPKLIALDAETLEVSGTWGPRPVPAQNLYAEQKAQGIERSKVKENIQRWYNADKGQTIQMEFMEFIVQREGVQVSVARP